MNKNTETWMQISETLDGLAGVYKSFGWSEFATKEYVRTLRDHFTVPPEDFGRIIRRTAENLGRMPAPTEMISAACGTAAKINQEGKTWISVEREVLNPDGTSRKYAYARLMPIGDDPREHVKPGETLLDVYDRGQKHDRLYRYDDPACKEAAEFYRLWLSMTGKEFNPAQSYKPKPQPDPEPPNDDDLPF